MALRFLLDLFLPILFILPFPSVSSEKAATFGLKLDTGDIPAYRLLNLLSHPDHSILPNQNSFSNKTALILAIGDFADSSTNQQLDSLRSQLVQKWMNKGGNEAEMDNLFLATQAMIVGTQIDQPEQMRATLMGLYAVGNRLLDDMFEKHDELSGKGDQQFVLELKKAFDMVQRVLAGLEPTKQMVVNNAELLDRVAGIGNKLEEKYGKESADAPVIVATILNGEKGADRMVGQLVAQSVDERMKEVAGTDGGWGYVKGGSDEDEMGKKEEKREEKKEEEEEKEEETEEVLKNEEEERKMEEDWKKKAEEEVDE